MKKSKSLIAAILLSTFIPFTMFQGCATTGSLGTKFAPLVSSTVSGGIIVAYQQTKDARILDYAKLLRAGVNDFLLQTNFDAAQLQADLSKISNQRYQFRIAQLILTTVVGVYGTYAQQVVVNGVQNNADLKILLTALVTGIDTGVAAMSSPPTISAQQQKDVDAYYQWRTTHHPM